MTKHYRESDTFLSFLTESVVAVVGYGNQGRAQALNMRDSGVDHIIIGSRKDDSYDQALRDKFPVYPIADAVGRADVVMMLVPDEVQPSLFARDVVPHLRPGGLVSFASGYNVAYRLLDLPAHADVVMVAPRMIGEAVRNLYIDGKSFPAFVDVEQDFTGHAEDRMLELALAIGALREDALRVTFAQEAWMDLLTEQAVWPLIMHVMESAVSIEVEAGLPLEAVLSELYLSKEPAEVFERAATVGLFEQMKFHSRTSQYGQLTALPEVAKLPIGDYIRRVLHGRIMSGAFATEWTEEQKLGSQTLERLLAEVSDHPISQAERGSVRSGMEGKR